MAVVLPYAAVRAERAAVLLTASLSLWLQFLVALRARACRSEPAFLRVSADWTIALVKEPEPRADGEQDDAERHADDRVRRARRGNARDHDRRQRPGEQRRKHRVIHRAQDRVPQSGKQCKRYGMSDVGTHDPPRGH